MKYTFLFMLFAIVGCQQAVAQSFNIAGLIYQVTSANTVDVESPFGQSTGSISIPSQVTNNGTDYAVTGLSINAFYGCTGLLSVTIPNSVTTIKNRAFQNCSGLTSVTIPNSVTNIQSDAFASCTSLQSISIPDSVTNISTGVFASCTSLTSVSLPNTITTIANFTFSGCTSLPTITIPNSVTNLGQSVFANCSSLSSITLPSLLQNVSVKVFLNCTSLRAVTCEQTIPISLFGRNVFQGVDLSVARLYVPAGRLAAYQAQAVWQDFGRIFAGCSNATTPTFAQVAPVCAGLSLSPLPTTSNEAITGIWSPAFNNVATTTYTFTPDAGQCASSTTMTITVNARPSMFSGTFYLNSGTQIQNIPGFGSMYAVYTSLTAPSPLPNSAILSSNTYYATKTENGCESDRMPIVIITLTAPTISSPSCGSSLTNISNTISCTTVPSATNYLFEVTASGNTRNYYSGTNSFNLTQLQGTVDYNTAYSIRVAAGFNGQYTSFGSACSITTPATPVQTKVVASQCGSMLTSKWTSVYCSPVIGATAYRFEWINGSTILTYTSSTTSMQLGNYTGWALNTPYSVRVAIQFGGTWQAYGAACNLTSPATFARHQATDKMALTVKAVPNPFETEYVLMAQVGNQTPVQVAVYDMLGKLVEQFSVESNELENHPLGNGYTSGIYNVMISQGDDQQVVRIIKK
ncbi:MAG: hypothetical protein CFE24_12525 [Flavobacterium sp. BFFFF2]|nr:MAG: hypothetical protein CFE24_12525 [Flavobacterium sp. BFFFF2]